MYNKYLFVIYAQIIGVF